MIQDDEQERDCRDQDALQAAHIRQDIQNRVASSFNYCLIQAHHYLNTFDQISII